MLAASKNFPAARLFPQETSAAASAFGYDSSREKAILENPQIFQICKYLKYLLDNENIALSRDKILNTVWNYDYYGDSRTIDSHIKKIRHKLGKKGKHIQTIRGIGYKFEIK